MALSMSWSTNESRGWITRDNCLSITCFKSDMRKFSCKKIGYVVSGLSITVWLHNSRSKVFREFIGGCNCSEVYAAWMCMHSSSSSLFSMFYIWTLDFRNQFGKSNAKQKK